MLRTTSYRDLKVIDIARGAGTSPATFYQYFPDVEHAVLVLGEQVALDVAGVARLARASWRGAKGFATATAFVEGFMDFWERNRPVLRVVDLATEEGDLRFQRLRVRALHAVTEALAGVIDDCRGDRKAGDDPMATAGVLIAMLAHVAAHRYGFEFWGIRTADQIRSLTRIVYWSVTGRTPPAVR
jgi:AcrR family transcriptional regulator